MQLLLATRNSGKVREIQALFDEAAQRLQTGAPRFELILPQALGFDFEVEEDGETYAENAALKALAYCNVSQMTTLADDSGLEVAALNGQPGVHSRRFCPLPDATDADRRAYLLEQLQGQPRPWAARFWCTLALVRPGAQVLYVNGICPGQIIPDERGSSGFGYDPIFLLNDSGKTMAELSMAEKNQLSHRARAVQALLQKDLSEFFAG